MCQCPISGSRHFYASSYKDTTSAEVCQCPISGSRHFYGSPTNRPERAQTSCQCPISGSRHFYAWRILAAACMDYWCVNALSRAHVISTNSMQSARSPHRTGVNALSRAHVISTRYVADKMANLLMCQCPISGSRHFYEKKQMARTLRIPLCQCPISGSRHFYPTPQNCLILCGFPAPFLHIFVRIF